MDIWILVIALLIIAIILLIASFFIGEDQDIDERLNEQAVQQSEELYNIKSRLAELEKQDQFDDGTEPLYNNSQTNYYTEEVNSEELPVVDDVTDEEHELIIRLYSQGYTMHEISQEVRLNTVTVQKVIDDYIENR